MLNTVLVDQRTQRGEHISNGHYPERYQAR